MLDILAIIAPIYIAILIGYSMTRAGIFAKADMRVFGRFVINLALPALLFRTLSQRQLGEILNVSYLLAYFLGSWAMVGLGYLWCRRAAGLNPATSAFYAMGMSCSNSGYVGYPILLLTLAPVAGVSLALNMTVENLLLIPFLLCMAESRQGGAGQWRALGKSLMRMAYNPLIIGLLAGLAVSILGLKLPGPVVRTVDMLATACSALSLFVIGGTLVGLPMRGHGSRIAPIVAGKLVLHPLLVFVAITTVPMLGLGEIEPSLRMAAVLMAAMPMMGIYATLGQVYGQEDFSAVTLLVTTVVSFFTLSGLLLALGRYWSLA
ncbi:AEC family transporter [Cupriavidus basilensis]|uniref:AEC family transporter n=1 Tax=Cupriavidus sp. SK-3 TaxID=1470558 RepID=UPI000446B64E|nr:AEC family transporter [Cupriavidus sp. SK-3]KDP84004.1 permease [Cupriavidus sp. SK-3]